MKSVTRYDKNATVNYSEDDKMCASSLQSLHGIATINVMRSRESSSFCFKKESATTPQVSTVNYRQREFRDCAAGSTQPRQNLNNISEYEAKIPGIAEFFSNRMMNADAPLKRSSLQPRVTSAAADATPDARNNLHHAYHRAERTEYPTMREARRYYLNPYAGCGKHDIATVVCVKPRLQWANSMKRLEHHQVANRSQISHTSRYLPHSFYSPYSCASHERQQNLEQCRTKNVIPVFQEQQKQQINEKSMRSPHYEQLRLVEHSLPPLSQPQGSSLYSLNDRGNYKEMRRKGICFAERLNSLIEFKGEHGHCNVPTCTRKKDQSRKYYTLGLWCGNVRRAYKRTMQQNKKPTMKLKDEHIKLLDEVGFRWQRCQKEVAS